MHYITPDSVVYDYIYFIMLMDSIGQIFGQDTEKMVSLCVEQHMSCHTLQTELYSTLSVVGLPIGVAK